VYHVTNPIKNDVINESNICKLYVFHIFGFAAAMSASFSAAESLSNPRNRMCNFPIGVLSLYHSVPVTALIIAPIMPMMIAVVMNILYQN
jgi:hypothetical protein